MKLDGSVISEIVKRSWASDLSAYLESLDLIFKVGDASQSVLVERKKQTKTWDEIYERDE